MKISQYSLRFAVVFGAALFGTIGLDATDALAYQQNVTCENGRNACNAHGEEAKPVVWDRSCVLFYMDEDGSNDFPTGPDGRARPALEHIVKKAFNVWTEPHCSGLKLIYGGICATTEM